MKCSIVVSTFNRSTYLAQLLTSLAGQHTDLRYEIVMIEAGSEESYRQMLAISRPYADLVRSFHVPGCTLGASRNFGVAQSRGEWCLFSDDDDVWHSRKIDAMMACSENLDLMSHAYVSSTRPSEPEMSILRAGGAPMRISVWSIAANVIGNRFGGGSSLCVRKVLALAIPFDELMRSCEDIEWSIRCLLSGARVGFVNQPLVSYRQHVGRMTGNSLRNARWELYFVRRLSVICLGIAIGVPLKVARLLIRVLLRH